MNLERAYADHQTELSLYLERIVQCPEIVAELVQECFIIFSREIEKQVIQHPRGFLFRIARNLAFDHLKHRRIEENYQSHALWSSLDLKAPSAEQCCETHEKLASISKIIEELPERSRKAFILSRVYGMTYAEIAVDLGITDSAVEKLLSRALLHCRKRFKKPRSE